MALTTETYEQLGSNREFQVASKILSESHVRIHIDYNDGNGEIPIASSEWDLLGSTVLFNEAPDLGSFVKITVSTDGEGLDDAPSIYSRVFQSIENVDTVASSISNVNTVAAIDTDVTTVADNISSVQTAATNIADIQTIADEVQKVIDVANDLNEAVSEIDVVANNIDDITIAANDIESIKITAEAISGGGSTTGGQFTGGGLTKPLMYTSRVVTEDTTIPDGVNALAIDSLSTEDGVTLTIEDGSVLKVV